MDIEVSSDLNKKFKTPKMIHLETPAFHVHCGLKKVKVGQKVYNREESARLYAMRIDELLADWKKVFGEPYRAPQTGFWEVFLADNLRDRDRIAQTVIGGAATKQTGPKTSTYIVGNNKRDFPQDELLHACVYHHTSHLITQQGHSPGTTSFPGWFLVGVAHWMEIEKFGETRNFTIGEAGDAKDRWKQGKWRAKVYNVVRKDKEPQLATYAERASNKLPPKLAAFSWSTVDYLIDKHGGEKTGDICRTLCTGKPTPEAIREHLGWSMSKLHDEWRRFVTKTYRR